MDTSRTRSSWNQMFQFQTKPKFRDEYWKSTNLISSPSKPNWDLLRPGMNSSEYSAILQIIPWTGVSWVLKILMSAKKGSNRISVEIPNHHESFSIKTYLISWACGCSTGGDAAVAWDFTGVLHTMTSDRHFMSLCTILMRRRSHALP